MYCDMRSDNPLAILKAACSIKPYYFSSQTINGRNYIEGTLKEPIGVRYLLDRYPNYKIVIIINEPIARGLKHYTKNIIEGMFASLYPYQIPLFTYFLQRERSFRNDIALAMNNKRVLLIHPPQHNPTLPWTTNPVKLKITYGIGRKEAEKILNFV